MINPNAPIFDLLELCQPCQEDQEALERQFRVPEVKPELFEACKVAFKADPVDPNDRFDREKPLYHTYDIAGLSPPSQTAGFSTCSSASRRKRSAPA